MAKKRGWRPPAGSDALEVLQGRYGGAPEQEASLEEIRADNQVARALYTLRTEAQLTQKELAERIGTQPSAISWLEDADYEGHSLAMLRRVARALGKRVVITFVDAEEGLASEEGAVTAAA